MKILVAYRFTGADKEELREGLGMIRDVFRPTGHVLFTMIEDIQRWNVIPISKTEAVRKLYDLAPTLDAVLCFYPDDQVSEGRGWEAGFFAGMGKPTIMAIWSTVRLPYHETLFRQNPANAKAGLPNVIRYATYEEVAAAFMGK